MKEEIKRYYILDIKVSFIDSMPCNYQYDFELYPTKDQQLEKIQRVKESIKPTGYTKVMGMNLTVTEKYYVGKVYWEGIVYAYDEMDKNHEQEMKAVESKKWYQFWK